MKHVLRRSLRALFGRHAAIWLDQRFQPIASASIATAMGLSVLSPILTLLAGQYGVSDSAIGLLMAAYSGASLLLLPFVGAISDRYGRKPLLAASLLLFGFGGLGLGLTTNFVAAIGLRVLQGIGWAGIASMTITLIGDRYRGERGNAAQAFRVFVIQATGTVVPIVVVWLVVTSWRLPFALYAVAIPIAIFTYVSLDESAADGTESRVAYTRSLVAIVQRPVLLPMLASFFPRMVIRYGFLTFVSVLVVNDLGRSPVLAGVLVSTAAGAKMVASSQMGRITDMVTDRFVITVLGFLFAGGGMIGLGLTASPLLLVVTTASTGIGDALLSPTQKGIIVDNVSAEYRGGLVGIGMLSQNAGATIAPVLLGVLLLALDTGTVFAVTGTVNAVAGVVLVLLARRATDAP